MSVSYPPQWQLLQNAYQQNRLSHAYLLSGMRDIGKTDFARDFSTFLLCEKKTSCGKCLAVSAFNESRQDFQILGEIERKLGEKSGVDTQSMSIFSSNFRSISPKYENPPVKVEITGKCRSCLWMCAQTHPDFLLIAPHEKNHSIKIDQIRNLSEKLSRTALCGGFQIVIISPADAMPIAAANALLKTLEEPIGQVLFFLIDHQEHPLPATIKSRCQKLFFYQSEKIKSFIEKEHATLSDELIQHLDLIARKKINPIASVAQWQKNMETVLRLLLLICIDISRIQQCVNAQYLVSEWYEQKLILIANRMNVTALQKFMQFLLEKLSYCAQGLNLNQQLCLEDVFIEWSVIGDR